MQQIVQAKSSVVVLVVAVVTWVASCAAAAAAEAPIKEKPAEQIGWDANVTKVKEGATQAERNVCVLGSGDTCQAALPNGGPGGFEFPRAISVDNDPSSPQYKDLYIADAVHGRVEELSPAGLFVRMFGWNVNKTKQEEGAPQGERNVCTAISGDSCQGGQLASIGEAEPGRFGLIRSLAVDNTNGDIYVAEAIIGHAGFSERVQKLTATGEFLLEIGKEVNETTHGDLCTAVEAAKCGGPREHGYNLSDTQPFAFGSGAALAVESVDDLVEVGQEHGVKIYNADGTFNREISLRAVSNEANVYVGALATDPAGDTYLTYGAVATIRKYNRAGVEINDSVWPLTLRSRQASSSSLQVASFTVGPIAVDVSGVLATGEREELLELAAPFNREILFLGSLLTTATGAPVTEFTNEFATGLGLQGSTSLAFDGEHNLFSVVAHGIVGYTHVPVGELITNEASCIEGSPRESDATFDCALNGQVDPWGVPKAEVWFEWGNTTVLGNATQPQSIPSTKNEGEEEPSVPVTAPISDLKPAETQNYYYRLTGYDANVLAPEIPLAGAVRSFKTPMVPPRIVGTPSSPFVRATSAVLFGELNPENAETQFYFEYGQCKKLTNCNNVATTKPLSSQTYGSEGVTAEVTGLQPGKIYSYRLVAANAAGEALDEAGGPLSTQGQSFVTAPAPVPSAFTGGYSELGTTSAKITGSVNPDGAPALYRFELAAYHGGEVQYGVMFSGSTGAVSEPVGETLTLTALQPETTYVYRIVAESGGHISFGAPVSFTTLTSTALLVEPEEPGLLPVPPYKFPFATKAVVAKCKRHYRRNKHGRCVRVRSVKGKKTRRGAVSPVMPRSGRGRRRPN